MDDRFTGHRAEDIARLRFDAGKLLLRIDYDDPGSLSTMEATARAIDAMAARELPVFVEPFISRRVGGRVRNDLSAEAVTRSIAIASGLGGTSAYTWLKLPVTQDPDDMGEVLETSTLPAVLLGGDIGGSPRTRAPPTNAGARRSGCPPCRAWSSAVRCSTRPRAAWSRRWTPRSDCCERRGDDERGRGGVGTTRGEEEMTYHLPAGKAADGVLAVDVTPEKAGWSCSSLRVLDLPPGGTHTFDSADSEWIVLPLSGACTVATADDSGRETFELHGRADVFSGVSDFAYVPRDARTTVTTAGGGRFALTGARCTRRLPARYGPASSVPVELRGSGNCSRQVNNFGAAGTFECDKLIAVEVITPGGNWSSFPRTSTTSTAPARSPRWRRSTTSSSRPTRALPASATSASPLRPGAGHGRAGRGARR